MFSSNSYNNGRRRSVVLNGVPIDITVYQLVYGGYHVIITFNGMICFFDVTTPIPPPTGPH